MLGWLAGKWRVRAACLLVAFYALCVGTPTAVTTFSPSGDHTHCLTDDQRTAGTVHIHQDGIAHRHSDGRNKNKNDGGDHSIKCCGLFSVSAIAPAVAILANPNPPASRLPALAAENRMGRGFDRIDRPPRSLLTL